MSIRRNLMTLFPFTVSANSMEKRNETAENTGLRKHMENATVPIKNAKHIYGLYVSNSFLIPLFYHLRIVP
ncbi:MAG: hypothetical protein MJ171_01035 [Clostridia bacterium]|nr:hypothetical protein [Clostridia bacterium]